MIQTKLLAGLKKLTAISGQVIEYRGIEYPATVSKIQASGDIEIGADIITSEIRATIDRSRVECDFKFREKVKFEGKTYKINAIESMPSFFKITAESI